MKSFIMLYMMMISSTSVVAQDWPALEHYRESNSRLGQPSADEGRIVFMGNSITEGWSHADSGFFTVHHLINRGIGGQTTPQMLLRFRQDVIDLSPVAVFILAGINDIAGNTGPSTVKMIEDNIENMATLAKVAGIQVVLCSVLPSNRIPWRDNMDPSDKIHELNEWIRNYAAKNGMFYLDYFSALADDAHGLSGQYSHDGVHPNLKAYKIMEQVALPLIKKLRER